MNRTWPKEAIELGAVVAEALSGLGAVDLARRAEADPAHRTATLAPVLAELGLEELDPAGDPLEAMMAARAVRAAGAVVCPWPLVQTLAVPRALRDSIGAVYVADTDVRRLEHLDLVNEPAVWFLRSGVGARVRASGQVERMPLDPFGVPTTVGGDVDGDLRQAALTNVLLTSFWILGAVSRVVDLAAQYAATRKQFGRPIVQFGAIQWRLADSAVARDGLEELASYTLWLETTGQASTADYLALRLTAQESAGTAVTHAHQIFASIGLCEEHDLAVIDRHVQASLRRPFGAAVTARLLADAVRASGFESLFPIVTRPRARLLASAQDG